MLSICHYICHYDECFAGIKPVTFYLQHVFFLNIKIQLASNNHSHYLYLAFAFRINQWITCVHNWSGSSEKCPSQFPWPRENVLKCLISSSKPKCTHFTEVIEGKNWQIFMIEKLLYQLQLQNCCRLIFCQLTFQLIG